jgi:hypothetical protein
MQALADEAMRNPQAMNLPPDADMQVMRSDDLPACSTASRNLPAPAPATPPGSCSASCRTCWRTCRPASRRWATRRSNQMMESLNELADMIRRQQEDLMNQTHRAERGLEGPDGEPMTPEEMQQALQQLQEQQQALAEALRN